MLSVDRMSEILNAMTASWIDMWLFAFESMYDEELSKNSKSTETWKELDTQNT